MAFRGEILTRRLKLWAMDDKDYEMMKMLLLNPIMYLHKEMVFDEQFILELIKSSKEAISHGKPGLRLIISREDDHLIGFGGVRIGLMDSEEVYESYLYLSPFDQRKGYGREAMQAMLADAIVSHGVKLIHSYIAEENYTMQALLEYCGYENMGIKTVNLNYDIVTRVDYIYKARGYEKVKEDEDTFFFNM